MNAFRVLNIAVATVLLAFGPVGGQRDAAAAEPGQEATAEQADPQATEGDASDRSRTKASPSSAYADIGATFDRDLTIARVVADRPAAAAGLHPGDRILGIEIPDRREPQRFADDEDFADFLRDQRPGQALTLIVDRGGRKLYREVTLEATGAIDGQTRSGARDVARGDEPPRSSPRTARYSEANDPRRYDLREDAYDNYSEDLDDRDRDREGDDDRPRLFGGRRRGRGGPLRDMLRDRLEWAAENPEEFRERVETIIERAPQIAEAVRGASQAPGVTDRFAAPRPLADLGVTVEERVPGRVRVAAVAAGSPAETAGLRAGDELLLVDGRRVSSEAHFARYVADANPDEDLSITVRRGDRDVRLRIARSLEH